MQLLTLDAATELLATVHEKAPSLQEVAEGLFPVLLSAFGTLVRHGALPHGPRRPDWRPWKKDVLFWADGGQSDALYRSTAEGLKPRLALDRHGTLWVVEAAREPRRWSRDCSHWSLLSVVRLWARVLPQALDKMESDRAALEPLLNPFRK